MQDRYIVLHLYTVVVKKQKKRKKKMAMQYKPIRLSHTLLEKIEAKNEKGNFSEWMREAAEMRLHKEQGLTPKYAEELSKYNRQLIAVGRNINQIAKSLNAGNSSSVEIKALEEVTRIIKGVQKDIIEIRVKL